MLLRRAAAAPLFGACSRGRAAGLQRRCGSTLASYTGPDPFLVLDVDEDTPLSQVQHKYKKLTLVHHPDRPTGSTQKMQELSQAYELIRSGEANTLQAKMRWRQKGAYKRQFYGKSKFEDDEDLMYMAMGHKMAYSSSNWWENEFNAETSGGTSHYKAKMATRRRKGPRRIILGTGAADGSLSFRL